MARIRRYLLPPQHEVAQATGLNLAQRVLAAEAGVAKAQGELDKQRQTQRAYCNQSPPPAGRPPDFEQRLLDGLKMLISRVSSRPYPIMRH